MTIVPLYAAALGLAFVALSVRTLMLRRRLRVAVGDGGSPALLRASRVHANFAEYVPLTLFLLFLLEQRGAAAPTVHGLCAMLAVGRIAHAAGVSRVQEPAGFRVVGMTLTLTALTSAAVGLLARSL